MLLKWRPLGSALIVLTFCIGYSMELKQSSNNGGNCSSVGKNTIAVKKEIKSFLCCLSKDEGENAIGFFSEAAFSNEAMFSESCAGYIKDSERKSKKAIKDGVRRFLDEFKEKLVAKNQDVSGQNRLVKFAEQLGRKVCNNATEDGFALVYLVPSETRTLSESEAGNRFLGKNLPAAGFFVSFIPVGEGMCYFFWLKDHDKWRIYHAALCCM